jgi:tripartite-type tricarboxylate transporter receptor subunit TctC
MRTIAIAAAAAAALSAGVASAHAQTFPARSITLIVTFAAGGPSDTIGRLVAQGMTQALGQQVVVENVVGAGGTIGIDRVAKAAPDGYTILISHVNHATAATLYRRLPYRSADDFETIGVATDGPMVLIARPNFPAQTIQEAIAHIRAQGERVSYGNAGIGSGSHLCQLMLFSALQAKPTVAAYRGTGPAMNDLLGGQIDLVCDQLTNAVSQIRGGRVRAYAVTSPERLAAFPDLPTMREAGLPGFEVNVWHGLYAPRGTPAAIVERLSQALNAALRDETVRARLAELSTLPAGPDRANPTYHARHIRAEIEKWGAVIRAAGEYAD